MSRTNNKQGPIVGVDTFEPLGDSTVITSAVGFLPFGAVTGSTVSGLLGGRNRWIGYKPKTADATVGQPLLIRQSTEGVDSGLVFLLTVQQFNGRDGKAAVGGSSILNTRRPVTLIGIAAAGTVAIGVITGTVMNTPPAAAAASTTRVLLPDATGLLVATFTFAGGANPQAGQIMIYNDGYQQFECVGTTTA